VRQPCTVRSRAGRALRYSARSACPSRNPPALVADAQVAARGRI